MEKKKRGRPFAKDPRVYPLRIRLTKSERDALNEACANSSMTVADMVRDAIRTIIFKGGDR